MKKPSAFVAAAFEIPASAAIASIKSAFVIFTAPPFKVKNLLLVRPAPSGSLSAEATASGVTATRDKVFYRHFQPRRGRMTALFPQRRTRTRMSKSRSRALSGHSESARRRALLQKLLCVTTCRKRKMATPNTPKSKNQEKSAFFVGNPLIFRGTEIRGGMGAHNLPDILFS